MPFGRGFATASILVLIALACIAIARRFERERRLISKLRSRDAYDPSRAVRVDELTEEERNTMADLTHAGVLRGRGNARYLQPEALAAFRSKRIRLAFSAGLAALALASLVAFVILRT